MPLQEELEKQGVWLFRYRSFLPIVVFFIGAILYLRTELYPGTFILEETPYEVYYEMACLMISLFGLFIRIFTVGYTPKNTSGRNVTNQVADRLNTTGMYSIVRHPLYVGNFFMWVGPALMTGNFWFVIAFCLFYWIYYERIMFAEEQYLRRKFGQTYLDWAQQVPAFFPRLRQFVRPSLPFSWKKVLLKEKNGLFAVFLVFFLFDMLGEIIENETDYNYFLIWSCIITGLSYVVLKYLKYRTTILREENR